MKKIIHIMVMLLLLMTWTYELKAQSDFASGNGTRQDPFIIMSTTQLNNMRKYVGRQNRNVHFELGKDLDMLDWANWQSIGTLISSTDTLSPFYGQFNGKGHVIRNFRVVGSSMYTGLFGVSGMESSFRNIGMLDVDIRGEKHIGPICASAYGIIDSCYVTGKITTSRGRAGGICGTKYAGHVEYSRTLSNSWAMVDITYTGQDVLSVGDIGGLCGFVLNSKIENCFAGGNLTAIYGSCVGGLVGRVERSIITSSYATGNITGRAMIGGFVGQFTTGEIDGCYTVGFVTPSNIVPEPYQRYGGFIGYSLYASSIAKNCYYNKDIYPGKAIGVAFSEDQQIMIIGLSTEEMMRQSSYHDNNHFSWRFAPEESAVWKIWEGRSYPYFIGQLSPAAVEEVGQLEIKGVISDSDVPDKVHVYDVKTNTLIKEATINHVNNTWSLKLDEPLFVGDIVSVGVEKVGRTPSGRAVKIVANNLFQAGDGSATAPYIIASTEQLKYVGPHAGIKYASLFFRLLKDIDCKDAAIQSFGDYASGKLFCANFDGASHSIRNLKITATGKDYVGLFSGIGSQGVVKNLGILACDITGRTYVGALAGKNQGTIENCFVLGNIAGTDNVGGICGENFSIIKTTYTVATTHATGSHAGGLVGYNAPTGFITQAYTLGKLMGIDNVGGFCGKNGGAITNSFAATQVQGASNIGGFCGLNNKEASDNGSIAKCYYDKEVSMASRGIGDDLNAMLTSLKGYNTAEMKATTTFSDWLFTPATGAAWSIWTTNSYPYFAQQASPVVTTVVKEFLMSGLCNEEDPPDSVFIYINHQHTATAKPTPNSLWKTSVGQSIVKGDVLYVVAQVTGKMPSVPAITARLSEDATLKSLSVANATLSPTFSPDIFEYVAELPYSASKVTIAALTNNEDAIFVDGEHPGTYNLTEGANEFKISILAANRSVQRTYLTKITRNAPSSTQLEKIIINNSTFIEVGDRIIIDYVADCGVDVISIGTQCDKATSVKINGRIMDGQPYLLTIPEKWGDEVLIELISSDGKTSKIYTFRVVQALPANVITQRWGNLFNVINNPENNGGYTFTSFQWYADGIKLANETNQYLRLINEAALQKEYHVALGTAGGIYLKTCPIFMRPVNSSLLKAYPNPVQSGQMLQIDLPENKAATQTLRILDLNGDVIKVIKVATPTISINAPTKPGMYLLQISGTEGNEVVSIIVN